MSLVLDKLKKQINFICLFGKTMLVIWNTKP